MRKLQKEAAGDSSGPGQEAEMSDSLPAGQSLESVGPGMFGSHELNIL